MLIANFLCMKVYLELIIKKIREIHFSANAFRKKGSKVMQLLINEKPEVKTSWRDSNNSREPTKLKLLQHPG
jgi:hypothetical protein